MGRPKAPVPAFDDVSPWGSYPPTRKISALLALAHKMPSALSAITKALRRPVKYSWPGPLDIEIWGMNLRLMPRGNMSEQKLLTAPQLFDHEEFATLQRLLVPGGVFVDIGANAGVYSFWAHVCMKGQGRIVAVEPDPEMRRRITFNMATNGISTIELFPFALSDRMGVAELRINPTQRGTNTLDAGEAARAGGGRDILEVEVTTLLDLVMRAGLDRIDALKLDIEGHEPPVLQHFFDNAPEALMPRTVISEFKEETVRPILALLESHGYRRHETTKLNFIFER